MSAAVSSRGDLFSGKKEWRKKGGALHEGVISREHLEQGGRGSSDPDRGRLVIFIITRRDLHLKECFSPTSEKIKGRRREGAVNGRN